MPLSKLQQALLAQQSQAAYNAARKKSGMNKQAKEESLKHSQKEKRAMKKVRQARKDREAAAEAEKAGTTTAAEGMEVEGDDGLVVIDGAKAPSIPADGGGGMDIDEAQPAKPKKTKAQSKKGGKNPNQLPVVPFDKSDTILLLGEANFSFSTSLLLPPHELPPHQILATSYDTERECYLKYPDAEGNVTKLREAGVKVEFKVDAGNLEKCKAVGKGRWSRVIFNFPHAGMSLQYEEDIILTTRGWNHRPRSKYPYQPTPTSPYPPIRRSCPYHRPALRPTQPQWQEKRNQTAPRKFETSISAIQTTSQRERIG
jgi:hypothetical protein